MQFKTIYVAYIYNHYNKAKTNHIRHNSTQNLYVHRYPDIFLDFRGVRITLVTSVTVSGIFSSSSFIISAFQNNINGKTELPLSATPLIFTLHSKCNIKMPPTSRPTANIEYTTIESYHTLFSLYLQPLNGFVKGD